VEDRPGDRSEEPTAAEVGGFLPPEPPGPEPELGSPAAPEPPAPPPPPPAWHQPPTQGWHQPPPGYPAQPPPGYPAQPPPGYAGQPPPPGYPPPMQQWPPPPPPGSPVWQPPAPPVPGNSQAVAGFVLSATAAGLLVISFGLSSIISIICAAIGIVLSRSGRRNVDEGRTPKHRDLAKAGFITGIVTLVVATLVTTAWVLVIVADAST
jgi:hypothetical protein